MQVCRPKIKNDDQGVMIVIAGTKKSVTEPLPKLQSVLAPIVNCILPYVRIVIAPGFHFEKSGMQAPGVRIPKAAAVSPAVIGFIILEHVIKGRTFSIKLASSTTAAGKLSPFTDFGGLSKISAGNAPNGHL